MKRPAPIHFGPPSAMSTRHRRHRGYVGGSKKDLTTGPILPRLIGFCLPLILSGMLQLLYNAADMAVLGQFATDTAVGAVGSCGSLINLLVNTFIGLATGASVCVAQFVGAKRDRDVSEVVHTAFSVSLILGVFVGLFGYLFTPTALSFVVDSTLTGTMAEATRYMRAYMIGVPGVMVYNYCAAALRAKGDSVRPLIFLGISGLANVLLNFWTVIGLGLGAQGVGIATAVSQYLAAGMTVIYMAFFVKDSCHLSLRRLVIKWDKVFLMLKIGIPASLQGVLFSFSNVLIQSSIQSFGLEALVNGNAAAGNVDAFVYTAQNAAYQGAITFVGQHVGARKYKRINRVVWSCVGLTIVAGIVSGALALFFGESLLGFFVSEPDAISYGMLRMKILVTTYFLCGVMEVGCGALRGMGKTVLPMVVSLAGACAFRVLWILTIFRFMMDRPEIYSETQRIVCLFLSYPASWILTLVAHFICFGVVKRRMERADALLPPVTEQE